MAGPCRVLIVDDSRVFRLALEQALADLTGVHVVGSVASGEDALARLAGPSRPDLLLLDLALGGMSGMETLAKVRELDEWRPAAERVGVVVVSGLARPGSNAERRALDAGAFDCVAKPDGPDAADNLNRLRLEVGERIRRWRHRGGMRDEGGGMKGRQKQEDGAPGAASSPHPSSLIPHPCRAVLIGVSTGGPEALERLLPPLCAGSDLPVLVVQHIPAGFSANLAECLQRCCSHRVAEARDGAPLAPKTVAIAPAGRHMVVRRGVGGQLITGLNDLPRENDHRPSADVLFRSASVVLGGDCVALILTGMGHDGRNGLLALRRAGAHVIAQDEASSVVWGMPRHAVEAGAVDEVLPLDRIASAVLARVGPGRSHRG